MQTRCTILHQTKKNIGI